MRSNYPRIKFQADQRIFLLFTVLNIFGYDDENNKNGMNKTRIYIRKLLKSDQAIPVELKNYLDKNETWRLSWRILHFSAPPRIKIESKDWYTKFLPKDDLEFIFFLKKFYHNNKLWKIWKIANPSYTNEINKLKNKLGIEYKNLLRWIPAESYPFETVIIIPNLLDAHWRGFSPLIKKTLYIVMGPSGNKSISKLFRHELLHGIFSKNNKDKFVQMVLTKVGLNENADNPENHKKTEYLVKKIEKLYQNRLRKKRINEAILLKLI